MLLMMFQEALYSLWKGNYYVIIGVFESYEARMYI